MNPSAPRSADASSIEGDDRRSRATTLLNTTTTQNVAWPRMIAGMPKLRPGTASTNDASASAVTIPGNAIGRTNANEIVSRPKNRACAIPNEARVPSVSAITVAASATSRECSSAGRSVEFFQATSNHEVVKNSGGHVAFGLFEKA